MSDNTPDTIRQLADSAKNVTFECVTKLRQAAMLAADEIERLQREEKTRSVVLEDLIADNHTRQLMIDARQAQLDAKTQELDLMRQVANANADKAIEAAARCDGLRAQLDAKDTEIERLKEFERLAAELATEQRYAKEQAIKWNDEAVKLKRLYADKCRDWARVVDEHNQMRANLNAKDTEIAARDVTISVLQGNFDAYAREVERLRAQIAERDATIARISADVLEAMNMEWDLAGETTPLYMVLYHCLQSLKEPNP